MNSYEPSGAAAGFLALALIGSGTLILGSIWAAIGYLLLGMLFGAIVLAISKWVRGE